MGVSGNRPSPSDRRTKISAPGKQEVRIAVISYPEPGVASCSCGWLCHHVREKPRENSVDRHITKQHNGTGIRI